ncbi:MAG TPA: isocitrate lyase/phosphoenolpyruvate mutase family protein [Thermoplasmata archaeon]|nr:isocitrate lyase/phosphoenolpyruvate mutase family protein [Thermoplasmata archaeon]
MTDQAEKAEIFRRLHRGKNILILPNGWDVASARAFEESGFPAIATSSAGMMVSLGYPDGERIDRKEFVAATRRISQALSVPLSADIVHGFGRTPKEVVATVKAVLDAGAVGINIEDAVHETKQLLPSADQLERLEAIRDLRDSHDVHFVINARTDALLYSQGNSEQRLAEAVQRGVAYRDAGADCVYPMGLTDAASIGIFVRAVNFPTNVMVRKGLPPVAELERLGVARVSLGPSASYAAMGLLRRASVELLQRGTYNSLVEGAITYDELNRLASPKHTP